MGPVIRDNRRIDPVTGQPRRGKHAASQPAGTTSAGRPGGPRPPGRQGRRGPRHRRADDGDARAEAMPPRGRPRRRSAAADRAAADKLQRQLAERTADLQRLQAEYANYRKRVDRDRATVREHAVAGALIRAAARARRHRPGTRARRAVRRLQVGRGLAAGGGRQARAGQLRPARRRLRPEDPRGADAHATRRTSTEDTCVEIFQPGYKVGERILAPGPGGGRGARHRARRKRQRRRVAVRRRQN